MEGSQTFVKFYLQESDQVLTVNTGENSLVLLSGRGKKNHFEIIQSIKFLTRPALQRHYFPRTQPAGIVSVTNLTRGREIANSSQLLSSCPT